MFQQVTIVGNLGRDPEMRFTPSGQAVTNLNVAVDESFSNAQGQKVKRTLWAKVSVWGKQAETCNQYLAKGRKVLVVGRLTFDDTTGGPKMFDRADGSKGTSFEITAETVRFLSPAGEGNGSAPAATEAAPEETINFN